MEDKDIQKKLNKSPFNSIEGNYMFTACVGENGGYGQTTIYDGYVNAVNILVESIKENKSSPDPMVYPILFCLRHSIELFLKKLYANLQYLSCLKNNPSSFNKLLKVQMLYSRLSYLLCECNDSIKFATSNELEDVEIQTLYLRRTILQKRHKKLEQRLIILNNNLFKGLGLDEFTHDLGELISKVTSLYKIDERIVEIFVSIEEPLLKYYSDIDPKGDAFRYLLDKKGNPHFQSKNIDKVNICKVYKQFGEITACFEKIEFIIWYLHKEYKTGTFTKKLPRSKIEEISKSLPKADEFTAKIKEVKVHVKKQYNITSNEFDRVLKIIRNHREFSGNMGEEKLFLHPSDKAFDIFAKCAAGLEDWESASCGLTLQELNLFVTFSDIFGWRYSEKNYAYFSEDLDFLYGRNKRERRLSSFDIIPKNEINYVIGGLQKCGQIAYAQKLKQYFEKYKCIAESESSHRE